MAKMKEIADAEEAFSEDEKEETNLLAGGSNAANGGDNDDEVVDVEGTEDHEVVDQNALPLVVPGFTLWNTNSKLASKGGLSQISKVSSCPCLLLYCSY